MSEKLTLHSVLRDAHTAPAEAAPAAPKIRVFCGPHAYTSGLHERGRSRLH
jgi:hypothetical protein